MGRKAKREQTAIREGAELYVTYGSLPQVNNVLYVLKPAVLGIIGAGMSKPAQ